jgi:hypothetical protein
MAVATSAIGRYGEEVATVSAFLTVGFSSREIKAHGEKNHFTVATRAASQAVTITEINSRYTNLGNALAHSARLAHLLLGQSRVAQFFLRGGPGQVILR